MQTTTTIETDQTTADKQEQSYSHEEEDLKI